MLIRRILLLLVLLPFPAAARMLSVATWNLEWLTVRPAGNPTLPPDAKPKRTADIARLRAYADILNADVVAMEEVDGPTVAAGVFIPDRYALQFTADHVVQRVGLAIRRGISFTANPGLTALGASRCRPRAAGAASVVVAVGPARRYGLKPIASISQQYALADFPTHLENECDLGERLPSAGALRAQRVIAGARW